MHIIKGAHPGFPWSKPSETKGCSGHGENVGSSV